MAQLSPVVKAIEAEMKRREISTMDLAAECGLSFSTLYRIFDGTTTPNLETLLLMLDAVKLKIIVRKK